MVIITISNLYHPDEVLKVGELCLVENPLQQILIWTLNERATAIVLNKQVQRTRSFQKLDFNQTEGHRLKWYY